MALLETSWLRPRSRAVMNWTWECFAMLVFAGFALSCCAVRLWSPILDGQEADLSLIFALSALLVSAGVCVPFRLRVFGVLALLIMFLGAGLLAIRHESLAAAVVNILLFGVVGALSFCASWQRNNSLQWANRFLASEDSQIRAASSGWSSASSPDARMHTIVPIEDPVPLGRPMLPGAVPLPREASPKASPPASSSVANPQRHPSGAHATRVQPADPGHGPKPKAQPTLDEIMCDEGSVFSFEDGCSLTYSKATGSVASRGTYEVPGTSSNINMAVLNASPNEPRPPSVALAAAREVHAITNAAILQVARLALAEERERGDQRVECERRRGARRVKDERFRYRILAAQGARAQSKLTPAGPDAASGGQAPQQGSPASSSGAPGHGQAPPGAAASSVSTSGTSRHHQGSSSSITSSSSASQPQSQHVSSRGSEFDGHWVADLSPFAGMPSEEFPSVWLHSFDIRGQAVTDGNGGSLALEYNGGRAYLQGGLLSIQAGMLIRVGRSGRTLWYHRMEVEHAAGRPSYGAWGSEQDPEAEQTQETARSISETSLTAQLLELLGPFSAAQ
uniref:Uncharacterized protein n=1 Tax=Pyrodinium bahamense TaxID=73915 RepID=A0A7S0AH92_9DINO